MIFSSVTAERYNNGNADNADLADRRGFSECDFLRVAIVVVEAVTLGKIRVDPPSPRCPRCHCCRARQSRSEKVVRVAIVVAEEITLGKVICVPIVINLSHHNALALKNDHISRPQFFSLLRFHHLVHPDFAGGDPDIGFAARADEVYDFQQVVQSDKIMSF